MPGIPEIKKKPGFKYHFVAREEMGSMMGRGWEVHPDYRRMWDTDPTLYDAWPLQIEAGPEQETQYFSFEEAVKAVCNQVELIPKLRPSDADAIRVHLKSLVKEE